MDGIRWSIALLILTPLLLGAWKQYSPDKRGYDPRRSIHSHTKRHMLSDPDEPSESKKRLTGLRTRDNRKKPSGHLAPLKEDDMDNDEVISVAIGPPPMRPKYEKLLAKLPPKSQANITNLASSNIIKDIFLELGREFLTRQVSDDFIFGQYVGNAMKNLNPELKLKMQHEVLNLIIKFQKPIEDVAKFENKLMIHEILGGNETRVEKRLNETVDDAWPDFSNIAKI